MSPVDFVGPFERWDVVVDGRKVPFLECRPRKGGEIDLGLDHRYGLILDVATAERVVPFLADAIAIAMGYTCHPRPGWDAAELRPPFPRSVGLGEMP